MRRIALFIILMIITGGNVSAATFTSGSTGADGPFNPVVDTELQLPVDGIFNFTTVSIPAGVKVKFKKNAANTPVYILATGDVTVSGTIDLNAISAVSMAPGKGGPGGFDGGSGGTGGKAGGKGLGPGGGNPGTISGTTPGGGGGGGAYHRR